MDCLMMLMDSLTHTLKKIIDNQKKIKGVGTLADSLL